MLQRKVRTMSPIVRNSLAVSAGLVIGSIVNMSIVTVGPMLIPPPEGVDLSDMDKLAGNLLLLKPANFVPPWLAHALGTLTGAFVAAKLAASHQMKLAIVIGVMFLMGGIAMVAKIGGPIWFAALDLIGAYLPMAYIGGRFGSTNKTPMAEGH